jgi:DNA-binding phage protein
MESVFEWIARLAPAGIVLKAIAVSVAGISILLIFVTARRGWRAHYFARRERQAFYTRQHWNELVSGTIPASTWRFDRLACEVMETTLLDSIEVSDAEELPRLVRCLRRSGLIDSRIEEARMAEGWQRWRALVALGRTRAPEALPALAEALDSHDLETRIAAVRGMGKLAIPEAAVPMLDRFCNGLLLAPWPVLKNAVLNCCAAKPGVLLLYLFNATGVQREMLARVLAEVANPTMGDELLVLAGDPSAEVRAAAARALSRVDVRIAVPPLAELARDPEWFVRLRAVVALGSFGEKESTAVLIRSLADRNRLVRQRAAWSLMNSRETIAKLLPLIMEIGDNYGLQAVVTELERSGRFSDVLGEVGREAGRDAERLASALRKARSRLALEAGAESEQEKVVTA